MLEFRTCEFGCKVINIEILEEPQMVRKAWKVIGRQAIFDCESNSINIGMSNEEAVENSLDMTVSEDYTNEVSGSVTVSIGWEADWILGSATQGLEVSAGYSHSWTNGKSRSKAKAFSSAQTTSMDKTLDSESGVAGMELRSFSF